MKPIDYLQLWQLARRRLRSEADYREFQAFQARLLLQYLARHDCPIPGRRLLDLGSGIAGYSREFAAQGAFVTSVDLIQPTGLQAAGWSQVAGSALAIPCVDASVDVVFCASLIEHVAQPGLVLQEIERVLKTGGVSYVSFPPYYSPIGGHEYAPFHYLGERIAMRLVRRRAAVPDWVYQYYRLPDEVQSFADLAAGWGLHKMTIRKFRRLVARTRLAVRDMSARFMPVSFVRWPVLGEVLTWHVQFLLAKSNPGAEDAAAV